MSVDQPETDLAGSRVLGDVVQGFLDGKEQVVSNTDSQSYVWKLPLDVESALQAGRRQVLLRVLAHIGHQTVERVVPGRDGPHDLVDGLGELARGVRDLSEMAISFFGRFPARQFT